MIDPKLTHGLQKTRSLQTAQVVAIIGDTPPGTRTPNLLIKSQNQPLQRTGLFAFTQGNKPTEADRHTAESGTTDPKLTHEVCEALDGG